MATFVSTKDNNLSALRNEARDKDARLADRARRLVEQKAQIAELTRELQRAETRAAKRDVLFQGRAKKLAKQKGDIARLERDLAEARAEARQAGQVAGRLVKGATALAVLPDEDLRLHVGTRTTVANFLANGMIAADRVREVFGDSPKGPVLDWGCGSGRTLNWLLPVGSWKAQYRGCDVDKDAIGWLEAQGVGGVAVCNDDPPLPYDDNSFDGLFSFSVLTHIPPLKHRDWYVEIHRILKPGGRALLTTQGEVIVETGRVSPDTVAHYRKEGWAYQHMDGHYKAAALASPAFTRKLIDDLFEVEDYAVTGYSNMDAFIVKKRPA